MTAALTLYAIEDDLIAYLDTLEGLPEEEAGLRAELEAQIAHLVAAELRKVDGVARMLAHFASQAELAAAEMKRLDSRRKCFERSHDRLESCARLAMEISNRTELKGETSTLSLRKNPEAVWIRDFDALPQQYKCTEIHVTPNKIDIKRAIKGGIDVPGAELVLSDRLVIR